MNTHLILGDIDVEVVLKDIKNIHLSVNPPTGKVRISAPNRTSMDAIRLFAISKLGWIKQQQQKLEAQTREAPREYVERESHYLWGKRYLLSVQEADRAPSVEVRHRKILLSVRPGTGATRRQEVLDEWYRRQVRAAVVPLLEKWLPIMGVRVEKLFIQKMKTKWGSCSPERQYVRLNTDLAKKPVECLEYVLVHEMTHILERHHNQRFVEIMSRFLPNWRQLRQKLNDSPLSHVGWEY